MSRHFLTLRQSNRQLAKVGIDRAPDGWIVELHEPKRSIEQNAALWSLLNQIHKQRPTHQGVKMSPELWKAVFMQALGAEMVFVPTLEGDGVFPIGHRTSHLTKGEFSNLIELILAWTAREGLIIEHFDAEASPPARVGEARPAIEHRSAAHTFSGNQGAGGGNVARGLAA